MFVFFNEETGSVLYTVKASVLPPGLTGKTNYVEADDNTDLGELAGWLVVEGVLQIVDLSPQRARATDMVNALSGTARSKLITSIPGQEMIYLAKEAEAKAYVADVMPDLANYPMLSSEIGISAPDAWSLAQLWLNMSAMWRQAAALLENGRTSAIKAINAASSPAEIEMIVNTFRAQITAAT